MKKPLLIITCLLFALFLLPGATASWGDKLSLGGSVDTGDWTEECTAEFTSEKTEGGSPDDDPGEDDPGETEYTLSLIVEGKGDVKIIEGDDNVTIKEGNHNFTGGSKLELSAAPAEDWKLSSWILDDNEFSNHKLSFTIKGDVEITAAFTKEQSSENDDTSPDKKSEDKEIEIEQSED